MVIDVGRGEKWLVRLYGVDVPKEGAIADRARQFVESLVRDKAIHARFEGKRNGEFVSIVGAGEPGVDVGLELVRAGLATLRANEPYKYNELARAEEEARREKRGLWAERQ
jgi:endonuclease YncB( thermonuclease family)